MHLPCGGGRAGHEQHERRDPDQLPGHPGGRFRRGDLRDQGPGDGPRSDHGQGDRHALPAGAHHDRPCRSRGGEGTGGHGLVRDQEADVQREGRGVQRAYRPDTVLGDHGAVGAADAAEHV